MSEKVPRNHEQQEAILDPERELPTAKEAEPLRPGEADPVKKLEQARITAEQSASDKNPLEQLEAAEKAAAPAEAIYINRELKSITLRRELQQIRRKLPASQRALSSLIHQPVVRAVSQAAGATVSRPSGLLGGGLVAFLGTSSYLYTARHLGFTYNYLVFLLFFIGGFLVGLGLELLVYLATASRRGAGD